VSPELAAKERRGRKGTKLKKAGVKTHSLFTLGWLQGAFPHFRSRFALSFFVPAAKF
jgi:hypothetical protein